MYFKGELNIVVLAKGWIYDILNQNREQKSESDSDMTNMKKALSSINDIRAIDHIESYLKVLLPCR